MEINPTIREDELDDDEEVELIASGYEWECPGCEHLNHEIEVSTAVQCEDCMCAYKVEDYHHATP